MARLRLLLCFWIGTCCSVAIPSKYEPTPLPSGPFVHPGIIVSLEMLEKIREQVKNKVRTIDMQLDCISSSTLAAFLAGDFILWQWMRHSMIYPSACSPLVMIVNY